MISNNFAIPLIKIASNSFSKMCTTKQVPIQKIFFDHWDSFLNVSKVLRRGLRPIVIKRVENCWLVVLLILVLNFMNAIIVINPISAFQRFGLFNIKVDHNALYLVMSKKAKI